MSERSVTHATFSIERTYDAPPERVFSAFSDPAAKARWFGGEGDGWETVEFTVDFQVGGREVYRGRAGGGPQCISVSLATVQLEPAGAGTRLTFTEQGAYLDGFDTPDVREEGTGQLLDALGAELRHASANA